MFLHIENQKSNCKIPKAYDDRLDVWYPSVRFRANDAVITPIREKELGDWRNISLEEKKLLYRYSYQSTLAEFEAPDGYWKLDWAWFFYITSIGILFMVLEQVICMLLSNIICLILNNFSVRQIVRSDQ